MFKWIYRLFGLFFIYTLLHVALPEYLLAAYNMPLRRGPYPPLKNTEAQALYDRLPFTADFHSDALLWGTDLTVDHYGGMVNFARLQETRPHLQMFTIVTKVPPTLSYQANSGEKDKLTFPFILSGRNPATWFSLKNRTLEQCRRLKRDTRRSRGTVMLIQNRRDLEKFTAHAGKNNLQGGAMLGIEGLHCLEGDIKNLQLFYDEGVRMASPFHLFDNELGGSAQGVSKSGLTDFGKDVIREMNRIGMVIDLAHASEKSIDDILAVNTRPLVVSHTGAKGICDNGRNLSDKHLRAIARSGGLIGIGFFKPAVCAADYDETARTMRYVADLTGIDHVCLGSDFDGAVVTPTDIRGLHYLVEALQKQGFTEREIRQIMYENYRRFWAQNLPQ